MQSLADRMTFLAGHVMHMSLDHSGEQSISVARCDCGWSHRIPWPGHHVEQDTAIETHWREVEGRYCSVLAP